MASLIDTTSTSRQQYNLSPEAITRVGSAQENEVQIRAPGVAAHHASIRYRSGRYVLVQEDGDSVRINRRRRKRCVLAEGDVVSIGGAHLLFKDLVGERIFWDKYKVLRLIGRGSFGAIYEVSDYFLPDIRYAMKVLRNTGSGSLQDLQVPEALTKKALAEAVSLSMLNHDNIVNIFLVDQDPKVGIFVLMEYLKGRSLREELDELAPHPMSRTCAFPVLRDICAGLSAAHAQNIVHADLTPGNIFLTQQGGRTRAKLIDFGMVSVRQEFFEHAHDRVLPLFRDIERIWSETPGGTPDYLSPEQASAILRQFERLPPECRVDERSDIYSLGVLIYEMICGRVPFERCRGGTIKELLEAHVEGDCADPRLFDQRLGEIALRAMQINPEDRFQSVQELLDALDGMERTHIPARPVADRNSTTCVPAIRRTAPSAPHS